MTTVRGILVILVLLVGGQLAFAQPPTEMPALFAQRAAAVKAHGLQVTGEHLIMWFTPVLSRQRVEAVVRRLDAAIAEAKRVIGTQEWQRIGDQKLTYYLVDEPYVPGQFVAGSNFAGEVFIPAEFIKQEGRAPLLNLGILELVFPKRGLPLGAGNNPDVRLADLPYSIRAGVPNYLTRLVAERTSFVETGFVDFGSLATVDALCAQRLETVEPAKVLPYMSEAGRPRELFGPERTTYAPPFYTCGVSFVKFLVEKSDLQRVVGLMNKLPDGVKAVQADIERITGQPVSTIRDEWQRKIGVGAAK